MSFDHNSNDDFITWPQNDHPDHDLLSQTEFPPSNKIDQLVIFDKNVNDDSWDGIVTDH